jgi:hypothetical protein
VEKALLLARGIVAGLLVGVAAQEILVLGGDVQVEVEVKRLVALGQVVL